MNSGPTRQPTIAGYEFMIRTLLSNSTQEVVMNDRKPIYARKNDAARIVSVPGGLWRVQVRVDAQATRTIDPWHNRSHPIGKSEALVALAAHNGPMNSGPTN